MIVCNPEINPLIALQPRAALSATIIRQWDARPNPALSLLRQCAYRACPSPETWIVAPGGLPRRGFVRRRADMPKRTDISSILVIGAGPIIIGQACEFDYAGTQACKALKAEGYRIILVNSNPA